MKWLVLNEIKDAEIKFSTLPRFNAFGMTPRSRRVSLKNKLKTVLKCSLWFFACHEIKKTKPDFDYNFLMAMLFDTKKDRVLFNSIRWIFY